MNFNVNLKNSFKVLSLAILLLLMGCKKEITTPSTKNDAIQKAIKEVNESRQQSGLAVAELTREHFDKWFKEFLIFVPLIKDRKAMKAAFDRGELPTGCSFSLEDNTADNIPSTINLNPYNLAIVEGTNTKSYLEWMEDLLRLSNGNLNLSTEPFQGAFPANNMPNWSADIQVRITPISVSGNCLSVGAEERDALKVEVFLETATQQKIADWFAVGFDKQALQDSMTAWLSTQTGGYWIDVKNFFPNWLKNKINTFPVNGDNEVCHGAAREFYYAEQEASLNASTEATTLLLSNYYCMVSDTNNLAFGDYLYVPGQHSGRYLLQDPQSGRHISFSVQSGGIGAYRFWWVDEDFSGNPFGNTAANNLFSTRIDVWRRCQ